MFPPLLGVYDRHVRFAALSERGRIRQELALMETDELILHADRLKEEQAAKKPYGYRNRSPIDHLSALAEILGLRSKAANHSLYRRNCRQVIRDLPTQPPVRNEECQALPWSGTAASRRNRRQLAEKRTPELIAEIRRLDRVIPEEREEARVLDSLDYLLNRLRTGSPNLWELQETLHMINHLKTPLPPVLEDKYIRLLARKFV